MKNEILNTIQDNMQTNRNPRTKIKCEEYENINQRNKQIETQEQGSNMKNEILNTIQDNMQTNRKP